LNAIDEALRLPVESPSRWRRWLAGLTSALLVSAPAAAVAAEGSMPGDLLYPVKLATEWVLSPFDDAIEARHRVEEAERAIADRLDDRVIADLTRRADQVVADLPSDHPLADRLGRITDRVPATTDRPAETEPTATTATTVADRPTEDDRPPSSTTTTTTAAVSDRPPPDSPPPTDG
jgi:hypothetical protein